MPTYYVRSTDGSNLDTGLTWALAFASFASGGAALHDVAGDTIYVSQAHSEVAASTVFMVWNGTNIAPVKIICANDNAEPPVSATTGGTLKVTGANSDIQITGPIYAYGLRFINSGTSTCTMYLVNGSNNGQMWEQCTFQMSGNTANYFQLNSNDTGGANVTWRNVTFNWAGTGTQTFAVKDTRFRWEGGGFATGTTLPKVGVFEFKDQCNADIELSGVDLSQLSSTTKLVSQSGTGRLALRNCLLPNNWTPGFISGNTVGFGFRGELWNCQAGSQMWPYYAIDNAGQISVETTVTRLLGATDGVAPYSLKYSGNANCDPTYNRLRGPDLSVWNDITSATVTVTVEILTDSVTPLTDFNAILDVNYMGSSASYVTSIASSRNANPIATAASNLVSSSAVWLSSSLTNPMRQQLAVTITPMQRGYIQGRVALAMSATVYVDPKMTLS